MYGTSRPPLKNEEDKPLVLARQVAPQTPNEYAAGVAGRAVNAGVRQPATAEPGAPELQAGTRKAERSGWGNAVDGLAGGAKAVAGAALVPRAAVADAVRSGTAMVSDGDPNTLDGGSTKYLDKAFGTFSEGLSQASGAAQNIKADVRDVLGVKPLPSQVQTSVADSQGPAAAPSAPTAATQGDGSEGQAASQVAATGGSEWQSTGIGRDQAGGEIFMRVGADGVPEFTNETATPGAASGAQSPKAGYGTTRPTQSSAPGNMTAPSGARVLASGSRTPDTEFAALGSAANLGNGVGGFSQNTAGSAALALERFGRANEIRAGTQRPRELGDNGGRVTVVRDSSRGPTIAELQNARLNSRLQQDRIASTDAATRAAEAGQRMDSERINQLNSVADLESKGFSTRAAQRIEKLYEQYDKAKPEDRAVIAEQLRVLAGKDKPDQYGTVSLGTEVDPTTGVVMNRGDAVYKRATGQLGWPGDSGSPAAMPKTAAEAKVGTVYQTAKGPARWDGKQFIPVAN